MHCRTSCGACCIAPSIALPYHGMPQGKAAGERCVHLDLGLRCVLFDDPRRPGCCAAFDAEPALCGEDREQAMANLSLLELHTLPSVPVNGSRA